MEKSSSIIRQIETPGGPVTIQAYQASDTIPEYDYSLCLTDYPRYQTTKTLAEYLGNGTSPATNFVMAIDRNNRVIGYASLVFPEDGDRWQRLDNGLMMEIRAVEVTPDRRGQGVASSLLADLLAQVDIEEKIIYFKGYSWTWDLQHNKISSNEYRQVLIRLFEAFGFEEFETDEATLSLKVENLFMCRLGYSLSDGVVDQFNRIRFNFPPIPTLNPSDQTSMPPRAVSGKSLFTPLMEEGYTSVRLYYNWKMDLVNLQVGREWGDDIAWEKYNHQFTAEQYLSAETSYLGNRATRELYRKYHLGEYLDEVIDQIKASRHQGLDCFYDSKRDIRLINYLHSSALGQDHIYRALRTGGICFTNQDRDEIDMLAEGLNLSRAMSFKNASARVPFGGCRISILTDPLRPTDREGIGFIAYAIDRTRSFAGPDMGFQPELIDVMRREGYTQQITGGWDSKVGPPGQPTAFGVYLAVKEAAYAKFSSLNLAGKKIVVQGVGAVGLPLVETYLMEERAEIYITDIDHEPIEHLLLKFPGQINVIRPEQVTNFDADIWIPCATSGVIREDQIKDLKYKIIIGAANNSLRALNQREEIRLAQLLGQRGILFQIDWLHNTAGIIGGAEEYIYQNQASYQRVMDQVENVCRDGVRKNLKEAEANDITPTEQAYRYFNKTVY